MKALAPITVLLAAWSLCGGLDLAGVWPGPEHALLRAALDGAPTANALDALAASLIRAGVSLLGETERGARAGFALLGLVAAALLAGAVARTRGRSTAAVTLVVYATLPLVYAGARHATASSLAQALFTALFAANLALDDRRARWAVRALMVTLAWSTCGGATLHLAASMEAVGRSLFPWTGLAAVALAARDDDPEHTEALLTTAGVFALVVLRGASPALLAAPVAVLLGRRVASGGLDRSAAWVVALVTAVQVRDLAVDPRPFPWTSGELPPLALEGVRRLVLVASAACVPALILALWGSRHARVASLAAALLASLVFTRGVDRHWSRALSPTEAWRSLSERREVATLAAAPDDGSPFHADAARFRDEAAADRWLAEGPHRALVVAPSSLARLNRAHRARVGRNVTVAGGSPLGWTLVTNDGARSLNPLDAVVMSARPDAVERARFEDALALDDVTVRVDRGFHLGSVYAVATDLRVLRVVAGDPQVFVHVDGPCARINVDHAPTGGRYPSALWLPGDRVRDAYAVTIPWYCPRGRYVVWTGLFRGDARLRVTDGAHDGDHRVRVATLDHPAR